MKGKYYFFIVQYRQMWDGKYHYYNEVWSGLPTEYLVKRQREEDEKQKGMPFGSLGYCTDFAITQFMRISKSQYENVISEFEKINQ